MLVIPGSSSSSAPLRAPVVAIGNFDGVHVGHQRLLDLARARATALDGQAVVLTFEPHPAKVLAPRLAPPLICTPAPNPDLLPDRRVAGLCLAPFTPHTPAPP